MGCNDRQHQKIENSGGESRGPRNPKTATRSDLICGAPNRQLQVRLQTAFGRLNSVAAAKAFPKLRALTDNLDNLVPDAPIDEIRVSPRTAELFATASVDIWLRAVHSFLVSASLTNISPIWA